MPRRGTWTAELTLDSRVAPTGPITIKTFDGNLSIVGTLRRADVYADLCRVLVVGGRGNLETILTAQSYRSAPASLPIRELLAGAGETLATGPQGPELGVQLPHWTRVAGTAFAALGSLVEHLGCSWRVLPDGSTWVGTDAWPEAPRVRYDVSNVDTARDTIDITSDAPWLLPGCVLEGRRVSLVVHYIEPEGFRSEVYFETANASESRLLDGFRKIVRRAVPIVDFYAAHGARVVSQNGDGSLELRPDLTSVPAISRVPIYTLPGTTVKVAAGARCLLEYVDGDPSRPMVRTFEQGGLVELQFGGSAPIARQGDSIVCTMPPVVPVVGTLSGQPFAGTMTITTSMTGSIITGSGRAKA